MNKDKYISLLYKKLKGDISLEEQSLLDVWVGASKENEAISQDLERDWTLTESFETTADLEIDVAADFQLLQQRILEADQLVESPTDNLRMANQPIGKVVQMSKAKPTNRWMAWASAAVVALALGFWFMSQNQSTVSNELLALETSNQEQKEVLLVDGTKIFLNENSHLTYPSEFTSDTRLVKLVGEAFFDVAKNPNRPFIIETDEAKVTVLGTSFKVVARPELVETSVSVKTGKVRLENIAGDVKVNLVANQRGVYNASEDAIRKENEDAAGSMKIKSDKILFTNTPLAEVITVLKETFNVKVVLKNADLGTCNWNGLFTIKDGISKIFEAMQEELKIEIKHIEENSFELYGGACTR